MPRPIEKVSAMLGKQVASLALLLPLAGCATWEGHPTVSSSCNPEQVWNATTVVLGASALETTDKTTGVLETTWREVEAATRAGAFQREVNRERVKYLVQIKPDGSRTVATVLQIREEWSPMGVKSRQWRAVPANPSEEEALAATIAQRLKDIKDKGC